MPKTFSNIPTNLVVGFLGVGKTSTLRHLLANRPTGEKWAVLVNELGQIGVDGALLDEDGVALQEVPGGCLCCVASGALNVGLNRLIRAANPDRILIEPTGVGHPAKLIHALTASPYDRVLDLRATIGLLDARHLRDPRYTEHPIHTDQIQLADVLVGNKLDTYADADRAAFLDSVAGMHPPKSHYALVEQGRIDPLWLDFPRSNTRKGLFPEAHAFLQEHAHGNEVVGCPALDQDGWQRVDGRANGFYSIGWLIDPSYVFDQAGVQAMLDTLGADRAKGVLGCAKCWAELNRVGGEGSVTATKPRAHSRFEIVHSAPLDADQLDHRLRRLARRLDPTVRS